MFDLSRHGVATTQHALPTSCLLLDRDRLFVVLDVWPKLKKIMSGDEILKAYMEELPFLYKMKRITCLGCGYKQCRLNFDYKEASV